MTEFKIDKTPDFDPTRTFAEFYCDGYGHTWVASVEVEGLPAIHVYCDGEMRIHMKDDADTEVIRYSANIPDSLNSDRLITEALENETIEFINNPWFDLYQGEKLSTGDSDIHLDCVGDDFYQMIETAKKILTQQLSEQ